MATENCLTHDAPHDGNGPTVCVGSGQQPEWLRWLNLWVCPHCNCWATDPDLRPALIPDHSPYPRHKAPQ